MDDVEAEARRDFLALCAWEDEGGTVASHRHDEQYGRRIEPDRSWTVYHVFTGIPAASPGGRAMIGLSQSRATDGMLSLNRRVDGRRQEPRALAVRPQPKIGPPKDCRT